VATTEQGDGGVGVNDPGAFVDGDITEEGVGSVGVNGRVNGDIEESGVGSPGNLNIDALGIVNGDVTERDTDGMIRVAGMVNGDVTEEGPGNLGGPPLGPLEISGTVNGNVTERNDGNLHVGPSARINGNVRQEDAGTCLVLSTQVNGNREGGC
jgi:cytoskeletal protein CcmA (bactofilin family)